MKDWRRYVLAFIITAGIFLIAFYIATRIDAQRVSDIRNTESAISIDLLSSETQFDLLGSIDCEMISQNPILSDELNSIADRLSYAENNLGKDNPEVIQLKQQYTLLEIKDYILMEQISKKCGTKPVFVLYFYSNNGDCPDCTNSGQVLTYLRQEYPDLRVYAFDYNLDLSALRTLISLRKINDTLPAFVINNRPAVYGFKNVTDMSALIPELKDLATTIATSTKQK